MKIFPQLGKKPLQTDLAFDVLEILLVNSRCALVRPYQLPRHPYHILAIHLVIQRSELPVKRLLGSIGQLALLGMNLFTHVNSLFGTHAVLPAKQTRSKYGPSLRMSYAVSSIFAYPGRSDTPALVTAPYRIHPAWSRLPRSENHGNARASDFSLPLLLSIACRWPYSGFRTAACTLFLHRAQRPSHTNVKGRRVSGSVHPVYPSTGLSQQYPSCISSRSCTIRVMLQPAISADAPNWVRRSVLHAVR